MRPRPRPRPLDQTLDRDQDQEQFPDHYIPSSTNMLRYNAVVSVCEKCGRSEEVTA
jgi:hypothetical protein